MRYTLLASSGQGVPVVLKEDKPMYSPVHYKPPGTFWGNVGFAIWLFISFSIGDKYGFGVGLAFFLAPVGLGIIGLILALFTQTGDRKPTANAGPPRTEFPEKRQQSRGFSQAVNKELVNKEFSDLHSATPVAAVKPAHELDPEFAWLWRWRDEALDEIRKLQPSNKRDVFGEEQCQKWEA